MPDPLRTLLHEWEVKPAVDPDFRAQVWRRIVQRKRRLSFRLWNRAEAIIGQPVWAAAVVAVTLSVGAVTGNAWREHQVRGERAAGLNAYVLAVDPVVHVATLQR